MHGIIIIITIIIFIRSSMHSPSDSGVNISNPSAEQVYQQAAPGLDYTVQRRDHVAAPPYQAMIAAVPTASQHMIRKFLFLFIFLIILMFLFLFS